MDLFEQLSMNIAEEMLLQMMKMKILMRLSEYSNVEPVELLVPLTMNAKTKEKKTHDWIVSIEIFYFVWSS